MVDDRQTDIGFDVKPSPRGREPTFRPSAPDIAPYELGEDVGAPVSIGYGSAEIIESLDGGDIPNPLIRIGIGSLGVNA